MTVLFRDLYLYLAGAALIGGAIAWFVSRVWSLRHADVLIASLKTSNERLVDQLKTSNESRLALEAELNEQRRLSPDSRDLSQEVDLRETAIEELKQCLAGANQDRADALQELKAGREEVAAMAERIDERRKEAEAYRSEIRELRKELQELKIDRTAVQEQLAASRRAHEDLTHRYVSLETRAKSPRAARVQAPEPVEAVAAAAACSIEAAESAESLEVLRPLDEVAGQRETARLEAMGLRTNIDLVRKCGPAAGLDVVAASTGIPLERLRRWTSIADLSRIGGLDSKPAARLHQVGINSIQELATANPADLSIRLKQAGVAKSIHDPQLISQWVESARSLQPMLQT